MKTVYLAGPITGLSFTGATDWREQFQHKLGVYIKAMSPLRSKDYLKNEKSIGDSYEAGSNHSAGPSQLVHVMSGQKGITTRDRYDVMTCDVILVNLLGATRVSIGTVMEIAWADMLRKPIVLVMEKEGNLMDHAMVRESCGFRVETLDEAAAVIRAICGE